MPAAPLELDEVVVGHLAAPAPQDLGLHALEVAEITGELGARALEHGVLRLQARDRLVHGPNIAHPGRNGIEALEPSLKLRLELLEDGHRDLLLLGDELVVAGVRVVERLELLRVAVDDRLLRLHVAAHSQELLSQRVPVGDLRRLDRVVGVPPVRVELEAAPPPVGVGAGAVPVVDQAREPVDRVQLVEAPLGEREVLTRAGELDVDPVPLRGVGLRVEGGEEPIDLTLEDSLLALDLRLHILAPHEVRDALTDGLERGEFEVRQQALCVPAQRLGPLDLRATDRLRVGANGPVDVVHRTADAVDVRVELVAQFSCRCHFVLAFGDGAVNHAAIAGMAPSSRRCSKYDLNQAMSSGLATPSLSSNGRPGRAIRSV